ncbi:UDP-N-acetylmuramate dehydrogenase [Halomonas sp. DP8Y7-1]|uniref:UDP-N-acetylmuramate dehydrogenase n=1 Tax=Halomonas sp. DP8Y7-1 TaxID=2859078 RepID=UPI001C94B31A|nr:UDP-N-acetylmuramate dehydrogenase [Halomonas sp. DP8Y7-1]MBY6030699.1 UDP-N-acetylmuramate dehydrogenase [Halomonas sp. DP8Y7-1]
MKLSIEHDVMLSGANTLGLPCRAERVAVARDRQQLAALLESSRDEPVTLLAGGSNLILPSVLPGLTLRPQLDYWWIERCGSEALVHVGAGVSWHRLVMALARDGWWGLENLALIPGHCGAAPIQNIGAYGVELADVLASVSVLHRADGRAETLDVDACGFGYRESRFKGEWQGKVIITDLILKVTRHGAPRLGYGDLAQRVSAKASALEVAEAVCQVRQEKLPDPQVLGNAGSFFKNPVVDAYRAEALAEQFPAMPRYLLEDGRVKLAAGWLIDQCGLKGWRDGHFGVHDRQALVLVHHGGGDARELLTFADKVAGRVAERFGVTLEREPRLA